MYENITNKMQFKVQLLGPTTFHNLLNKNSSDTSYEKIPGSQEYLISVLQQKIEEQKEIEKQNKKKHAMLMNSAACASYVISHMR